MVSPIKTVVFTIQVPVLTGGFIEGEYIGTTYGSTAFSGRLEYSPVREGTVAFYTDDWWSCTEGILTRGKLYHRGSHVGNIHYESGRFDFRINLVSPGVVLSKAVKVFAGYYWKGP